MIHAEISIYPIGTDSTSVSFYVSKALEMMRELKIKHQVTPMGTILEAKTIKEILDASSSIIETVHRLGVRRVEAVLKIDSRTDKEQTLDEKMNSLDRFS